VPPSRDSQLQLEGRPLAESPTGALSARLAPESMGQQGSSPPKRVHFNDRTSIRSFESVSSLASNSTAVQSEIMRQRMGSPDSMGSGSTSRLSADSPDLRKGDGAAIYAVRGDPELELAETSSGASGQQQQQQHSQLAAALQQQQQQQQLYGQQHTYGSPLAQGAPFIRMTAPPSISTGAVQPVVLARPLHYIARPASQVAAAKSSQQELEEDEDPNYALRLRQAATSRVFNFAQASPPIPPHLLPAHTSRAHQPPQSVRLSPVVGLASKPAGSMQRQQQQSRRQFAPAENLLNFQTEV